MTARCKLKSICRPAITLSSRTLLAASSNKQLVERNLEQQQERERELALALVPELVPELLGPGQLRQSLCAWRTAAET